jgi:cell division septation protein DedD
MRPGEARVLLGLEGDANEEELRTAYRSMLRIWHPDRFPEDSDLKDVAHERTRSIIEAFRVLQEAVPEIVALDAAPGCPPAAREPADRGRDPLHFSGPTPEKAVATPKAPERPARYRRWAAALVLTAGGVGAGLFGIASAGDAVETVPSLTGSAAAGMAAADGVAGEASAGASSSAAPAPEGSTAEVPRAAASLPVARYSVAIAAFRDLDRAMTVVERVRRGAPGVWTTTVPIEVDGTVFHRILVGFSPDRASLDGVVERVSAALREDPGPWILRDAGLTLCLADNATVADARAVMLRLAESGVVSFAVRAGPDGSEAGVRVCSGSFSGPGDAVYLQLELVDLGFEPVLEVRVGVPIEGL